MRRIRGSTQVNWDKDINFGGHKLTDVAVGVLSITELNDDDAITKRIFEDAVSSIQDPLIYQGTWNADTNIPALSSGAGTAGHFYIVSVAGSTELDGITDWRIGDWAVFNGTAWEKVDNTEPDIATKEEAEEGVDNTKMMTPLRTKEAIDYQVPILLSGRALFKGYWDPVTDTPQIGAGSSSNGSSSSSASPAIQPEAGDFYIVSQSGTRPVDGNSEWVEDDWIFFNGYVWVRIPIGAGNTLDNYYLKSEFIDESGGAVDAGKPIKTNTSGKIDITFIPDSLLGGINYQGAWDADTNNPALTSSTGTKGHYYVVNVAGATNLDGITDWRIGDWAIFNGTAWEKIDNTEPDIATKEEAEDGVDNTKMMTPLRTKEAIDYQVPILLAGRALFKGYWDPVSNTPVLTSQGGPAISSSSSGSGFPDEGDFYIVSQDGTIEIDGNSEWREDDWIFFNGYTWVRVPIGAAISFEDLDDYYRKDEFIFASSSGRSFDPVTTNENGVIDSSLLPPQQEPDLSNYYSKDEFLFASSSGNSFFPVITNENGVIDSSLLPPQQETDLSNYYSKDDFLFASSSGGAFDPVTTNEHGVIDSSLLPPQQEVDLSNYYEKDEFIFASSSGGAFNPVTTNENGVIDSSLLPPPTDLSNYYDKDDFLFASSSGGAFDPVTTNQYGVIDSSLLPPQQEPDLSNYYEKDEFIFASSSGGAFDPVTTNQNGVIDSSLLPPRQETDLSNYYDKDDFLFASSSGNSFFPITTNENGVIDSSLLPPRQETDLSNYYSKDDFLFASSSGNSFFPVTTNENGVIDSSLLPPQQEPDLSNYYEKDEFIFASSSGGAFDPVTTNENGVIDSSLLPPPTDLSNYYDKDDFLFASSSGGSFNPITTNENGVIDSSLLPPPTDLSNYYDKDDFLFASSSGSAFDPVTTNENGVIDSSLLPPPTDLSNYYDKDDFLFASSSGNSFFPVTTNENGVIDSSLLPPRQETDLSNYYSKDDFLFASSSGRAFDPVTTNENGVIDSSLLPPQQEPDLSNYYDKDDFLFASSSGNAFFPITTNQNGVIDSSLLPPQQEIDLSNYYEKDEFIFASSSGGSFSPVKTNNQGLLDLSLLPARVRQSLIYRGTWDAASNTPALASGTGGTGDVYVVTTAGVTDLDGYDAWSVGDWAVFTGAEWVRIDNSPHPGYASQQEAEDGLDNEKIMTPLRVSQALEYQLAGRALFRGYWDSVRDLPRLGTSDCAGSSSSSSGSDWRDVRSLYLDGVNESVNAGNIHNFDRGDKFSVSMWVNFASVSQGTFFGKGSSPTGGYFAFLNGGRIFFAIFGSDGEYAGVYTPDAMLTNVWQHYAFTYDGSSSISGMKVYIDGIEQETLVLDDNLTKSPVNVGDLRLGIRNGGTYLKGYMNEIAIYNTELKDRDIKNIHNCGCPVDVRTLDPAGNLQSYWLTGDYDTEPTLLDQSGNGLNATIINGATFSTEVAECPTTSSSSSCPYVPEGQVFSVGDFYIVNKDGSTCVNGENCWLAGDWVFYTDDGWVRIPIGPTPEVDLSNYYMKDEFIFESSSGSAFNPVTTNENGVIDSSLLPPPTNLSNYYTKDEFLFASSSGQSFFPITTNEDGIVDPTLLPPYPVAHSSFVFNKLSNKVKDEYLNVGSVSANESPIVLPRAGIITMASWRSSINASGGGFMRIRINGSNVASVTITNGTDSNYVNNFNVAFSEGDELSVYIDSSELKRPTAIVSVRWDAS